MKRIAAPALKLVSTRTIIERVWAGMRARYVYPIDHELWRVWISAGVSAMAGMMPADGVEEEYMWTDENGDRC